MLYEELEQCVLQVERLERNKNIDDQEFLNEKSNNNHMMIRSPLEYWSFVEKRMEASDVEAERELMTLKTHVKQLRIYMDSCDLVIAKIRKANAFLYDLESKHETVYEKTNSLHETCRNLLEEQQQFQKILRSIQQPMEYFEDLGRIGQLFNIPVESRLATLINKRNPSTTANRRPLKPDSPEFFKELQRLDECIDFIEENSNFKDYQEYSTKFRKLFVQGLGLVRNQFIHTVHGVSSSVRIAMEAKLSHMNDATLKTDAYGIVVELNGLMYGRFAAQTDHFREYISEIEKLCHRQEAFDILLSAQEAYSARRLDLLYLYLGFSPQMKRIDLDLVSMLRLLSPYFLNICKSEAKLYYTIFNHVQRPTENTRILARFGSSASNWNAENIVDAENEVVASQDPHTRMLVQFCGAVYDRARPAILNIHSVEVLCDVARVIQSELIEGQIQASYDAGEALENVLLQVLQDVQERLIFTATNYITKEIKGYEPTDSELNYPTILANVTKPGPLTGCYPPLENTLVFLGMIFRCVEMETFEDLTQEVVQGCTIALKRASIAISQNGNKLDGDLFLIKHLLILREQISPFNTHLTLRELELDFSTTSKAFSQFMMFSKNIFARQNNAFVDLVYNGVPSVQELEVDCKRDIEVQLKENCEHFIVQSYEQATATLKAFLQRASKPLDDNIQFHEQDFAKPERLDQLLNQSLHDVPHFVQTVYEKMTVYFGKSQTLSILFKPIKVNIFAVLTQFMNCIEANYPPEYASSAVRILSNIRIAVNAIGLIAGEQNTPR